MTALRVVTATAIAALIGLGLARAPLLLEPGRSDRAGVTLSPPVRATGGRESDWTHDAARAVVHKHDGVVALRARAKGLQLLSRQLPVRADRCYSAQLRIAATQGVSFVLLDGPGVHILSRQRVPMSARVTTTSFSFRAPQRRVSLALFASRPGASLSLADATIRPQPCATRKVRP